MSKPNKSACRSLLVCSILWSTLLCTSVNAEKMSVDVMNDATIFAKFDDDIPAVVNYFTQSSVSSIINFYEERYGKAINTKIQNNRLEKSFLHNELSIKIIISKQNNSQQVDILITR